MAQGPSGNDAMIQYIVEDVDLNKGGSTHTQLLRHFSSSACSEHQDLFGMAVRLQRLVMQGAAYSMAGADPTDSRFVLLEPTRQDPSTAMGCTRLMIRNYEDILQSHDVILHFPSVMTGYQVPGSPTDQAREAAAVHAAAVAMQSRHLYRLWHQPASRDPKDKMIQSYR